MLERTSDGITVDIRWTKFDSPYATWFVDADMRGPDAPPKVGVPGRLLFSDDHGSLLLVGCWANGYHINLGGQGGGSGQIAANYAVLDVRKDVDYRRIDALRGQISGLRSWLGVSSIERHHEWGPKNSATITARSADPIKVGGEPALTFIPTWNLNPEEDSLSVTNEVVCETVAGTSASWQGLNQKHLAIRDLLALSQWRPEVARIDWVQRADDPYVSHTGEELPMWKAVVSADVDEAPPPARFRRHLIVFEEIGIPGMDRWLQLRDEFARALDPVISTLYLTNVNPITTLAQTGPGIEALGYLLMRRDGVTKKIASEAPLRARLDRILTDVGMVLPFDGPEWAAGTVTTYNSLKHANRAAPSSIDMINRWRETVLVMRAWVALEIGTPPDALADRLRQDEQSHPYVMIDDS